MPALADWTVLIYSSASSDIVDVARRALQEVAADGHHANVRVVAQLGTPSGTDRFEFSSQAGAQPRVEHLPVVDMSQPATLQDSAHWVESQFPAHHYLVVLGGHASGFMGAVTNAQRSRVMPPQGVVAALGDMRPDVVTVNACLSQDVGVGLTLGAVTPYLVASQAEEHQEGMALGAALSMLAPGTTPAAAAVLLARQAAAAAPRTHQVSAIDTQALRGTAAALDQLGCALLDHPQLAPAVQALSASLPSYREQPGDAPLTDLKDVAALAQGLQAESYPTDVRQAARALSDTLKATVLATVSTDLQPAPGGLSTWVPTGPLTSTLGPVAARVEDQYRTLLQPYAPHWVQAVTQLLER